MTKKERIEILKKAREKEDKLFHNDFIRCRGDKRKKINKINILDVLISQKIKKVYGKRKKIHCIYKCGLDKAPNIVYLIDWEKDILHSKLISISKKEINEFFIKNKKEIILLEMLNKVHSESFNIFKKYYQKIKKSHDTNLSSKITLEKSAF